MKSKRHVTNDAFVWYSDLWKRIFGKTYQEKYVFDLQFKDSIFKLSGGGGDYPTYDISLAEEVKLGTRKQSFYDPLGRDLHLSKGYSSEHFYMPKDWTLLVVNKSTIARVFIDASFTTFIDNGWKGHLTIEIRNDSYHHEAILPKGAPILQVLAIPTFLKSKIYSDGKIGKYQDQPAMVVHAK